MCITLQYSDEDAENWENVRTFVVHVNEGECKYVYHTANMF